MIENQIKIFFGNEKAIVAVYLFGSYASGKVPSCSDLDLAILFDSRNRPAINRRLDKYLIDSAASQTNKRKGKAEPRALLAPLNLSKIRSEANLTG